MAEGTTSRYRQVVGSAVSTTGAVALALVAIACSTDPGGHVYTAMNESDHAVIVNLSTDRPRTVVLPAHSRAVLSEDWSGPTEDRPWRLTVLDDSCAELTSITVTHGYLNLHVAADGSIAWDHVRTYRPTPSGIRPAGQLEDAACG